MLPLIAHLAVFSASLAPASPPPPQPESPKWLVMAYMDADNNLETPMLMDMVEMTAAEESKDVVVLALVDRGMWDQPEEIFPFGYVAGLPDWETGKLVRVRHGKLEEIEDWGEVDMGDPATLERLIRKGLSMYKPQRVGLVMSDHGGGWQGGWSDDMPKALPPMSDEELEEHEFEFTDLSLQDIRYGLARGLRGRRLDFLGFDACLMANLETSVAMADYADWMIASEEVEPGYGWHFEPILNYLVKNPDTSVPDLGKAVCDSFMSFYAEHPGEDIQQMGKESTLSVVDLKRVEMLYKQVDILGDMLENMLQVRPDEWIKIANAHDMMQEFGVIGDEADFAFFDIESMCDELEKIEDIELSFKIQLSTIRSLLKKAVTHSVKGEFIEKAGGLTVFWPRSDFYLGGEYEDLPNYENAFFDRNTTPWKDFANSYVRALMTDDEPPHLTDVVRTVEGDTVMLSSELTGNDVASLRYALFVQETEKSLLMLGSFPLRIPADGQIKAPFFGGWYVLTDGERYAYVPILDAEFGETSMKMYVSMLMREKPEDDWKSVLVAFRSGYGPEDYGKFLYAVDNSGAQTRYLLIPEGAEFQMLYPRIIGEDESELVVVEGTQPFVYHKNKRFEIGYTDLQPGTYLVGFVAEDFSGNIASTLIGADKPGPEGARSSRR